MKLLGDLDSKVAGLFQTLCSASVILELPGEGTILDARVPALVGNAASNSLAPYGLNFDQLNILHEFGLIIPAFNCYFDYNLCIVNERNEVPLAFSHQKSLYALVPMPKRQKTDKLHLTGVSFSSSGKELSRVVDIVPLESYTNALRDYFAKHNLVMTPIRLNTSSR